VTTSPAGYHELRQSSISPIADDGARHPEKTPILKRINAYDELFRRLRAATSPPPSVVYHYTTPQGVLGIVDSKALWATDIRFLNDSHEYRYALEMTREELAERQRCAGSLDGPLIERFGLALDEASRMRTYVCCFSTEPDQLSQWRGYGSGRGYAIGFKLPDLLPALSASQQPIAFLQCEYRRDVQRRLLSEAIDQITQEYRGVLERHASREGDPLVEFEADFYTYLVTIAAAFKHEKFSEEREWRIVVRSLSHERERSGRQIRVGGRGLIPHLEVELCQSAQPLRLGNLVVGPNPHMADACDALSILLTERGVEHEGVIASAVPFRDW
jgi:hypothetical protein